MKISAIITGYSSYYYNPNEANRVIRVKTGKETEKMTETIRTSLYQTNIYDNSAQYVKNAYTVSFRPHDMIINLQETQ